MSDPLKRSVTHDDASNGIRKPRSLDFENDKKVAPPRPPQQSSSFRLRSLTANAADSFRLRTNDEIHQSIDLCPVMQAFLDTPQMQRLRHISQLGTSHFVFINANHNRFEHSLGVAHLAERMCKRIMDRQPALGCTKKDVLCIKLAGLLHDIGHGPFSHVYEDFITNALPRHLKKQQQQQQQSSHDDDTKENEKKEAPPSYYSTLPPVPENWKHECVSLMMIDAALEYLGLQIDLSRLDEPLRQIGNGIDAKSMKVFDISSSNNNNSASQDDDDDILTSRDFVFIKECIWGRPLPEVQEYFCRESNNNGATTSSSMMGFVGRPEIKKEWLYDIVSNRHSGLDVDKVDYFARDERRAFGGAGEIDKVMIEEAIVAWAKCTDPDTCSRCQCGRKRSASTASPKLNVAVTASAATKATRSTDMDVDDDAGSTDSTPGSSSSTSGRHLMICYPEKLIKAVMAFFVKRFIMHSKVYQHKTIAAVGHMICDIFKKADPYLFLPSTSRGNGCNSDPNAKATPFLAKTKLGHDGGGLPVSRAMLDAGVMLRCRDSITDQIANTTDPQLQPARNLVYRLWHRDLYKCVATKHINMKDPSDLSIWKRQEEDIVREMMAFGGRHDQNDNNGTENEQDDVVALHEDDFIVERCSMHHGCKDKNPLSKMRFLPKQLLHKLVEADIKDLPEAVEADESTYEAVLPRLLQENSIRVYSCHSTKRGLVSHVFSAWLDQVKSQHSCAFHMTPEQPQEAAMLSQDSELDPASAGGKSENGQVALPPGWSSVVSPPLHKRPRMSSEK